MRLSVFSFLTINNDNFDVHDDFIYIHDNILGSDDYILCSLYYLFIKLHKKKRWLLFTLGLTQVDFIEVLDFDC